MNMPYPADRIGHVLLGTIVLAFYCRAARAFSINASK